MKGKRQGEFWIRNTSPTLLVCYRTLGSKTLRFGFNHDGTGAEDWTW